MNLTELKAITLGELVPEQPEPEIMECDRVLWGLCNSVVLVNLSHCNTDRGAGQIALTWHVCRLLAAGEITLPESGYTNHLHEIATKLKACGMPVLMFIKNTPSALPFENLLVLNAMALMALYRAVPTTPTNARQTGRGEL